ncbi:MAG TPA: hypothetical protein VFE62_21290 [Gemmataceae bacterium]|nr:hypothetical protein [Gemmataceae bacterium]
MIEDVTSQSGSGELEVGTFFPQAPEFPRLKQRSDAVREELAALHELLLHVVTHAEVECDWDALVGSETVLIADDQVVVRAITQGILESFGYTVLVADTEMNRWPTGYPIDLLLLNLPACDESAVEQVRASCLRFSRVIVSTPLPDGPARDRLRAIGVRDFVHKPFRPLELARGVRRVLDLDRTCLDD